MRYGGPVRSFSWLVAHFCCMSPGRTGRAVHRTSGRVGTGQPCSARLLGQIAWTAGRQCEHDGGGMDNAAAARSVVGQLLLCVTATAACCPRSAVQAGHCAYILLRSSDILSVCPHPGPRCETTSCTCCIAASMTHYPRERVFPSVSFPRSLIFSLTSLTPPRYPHRVQPSSTSELLEGYRFPSSRRAVWLQDNCVPQSSLGWSLAMCRFVRTH